MHEGDGPVSWPAALDGRSPRGGHSALRAALGVQAERLSELRPVSVRR